MSNSELSSTGGKRPSNVFAWCLDTMSSIWFGVGLLVLIFIYSSIGSAAPPIRQGALADWLGLEFLRFEKSEMEWFSWWPFQVLLALFCVSLVLATLRRSKLSVVNAGVWITHVGIIVLAISAAIYFGRKVEGDALLYHSRALIQAPGMSRPASLVIRPQATIDVAAADRSYRITVTDINPEYEILTGEHRGEKTTSIWLNVQSTAPPHNFIRVLVLGHKEFTEDVIQTAQGMQRVAKLPGGKKLADEALKIELDYDRPVDYFYHTHQPPIRATAAIYARLAGEREWRQYRFEGVPHYYEWISDRGELWPMPDGELPSPRPLDLKAQGPVEGEPIDGIDLRMTDYLPYATLDPRWVGDGAALNPLLLMRLSDAGGEETRSLLAFDPRHSRTVTANGAEVAFAWASSPAERDQILEPPPGPMLLVRLPAQNVEQTIDVSSAYRGDPVAIDGTEYTVQIPELVPAGILGRDDSRAWAIVRVTRGDQTFQRMVQAGDTSGGQDVDDRFNPLPEPADSELAIEYVNPAQPGLLLVAGPDRATVETVRTGLSGERIRGQAAPGDAIEVFGRAVAKIQSVIERAQVEVKPEIVPRHQRQSLQQQGKVMSLVRVELEEENGLQTVWLPFSHYAFPDAQRAYPRRIFYRPQQVRLADGRMLELLYSRWRDPLPSPIVLDRFILETYPGGDRESDFISLIRTKQEDGWSELQEVKSNHPARHGDLWYFQAQWDPGVQSYTVLGVGNREAVYAMLAGVCISIAGMIYAFYVKPAIRRRRQSAGQVMHEQVEVKEDRSAEMKKDEPVEEEVSVG